MQDLDSLRRDKAQNAEERNGGVTEATQVAHSFSETEQPAQHEELESNNSGLPATKDVRKHYKDYSHNTALLILSRLPKAKQLVDAEGVSWGSALAQLTEKSAGTINHYLNALKLAGLDSWANVPLPARPRRAKQD